MVERERKDGWCSQPASGGEGHKAAAAELVTQLTCIKVSREEKEEEEHNFSRKYQYARTHREGGNLRLWQWQRKGE